MKALYDKLTANRDDVVPLIIIGLINVVVGLLEFDWPQFSPILGTIFGIVGLTVGGACLLQACLITLRRHREASDGMATETS